MAWTDITSFDGTAALAGGGTYAVLLRDDQDAALVAEQALTTRVGEFPLRESVAKQARTLMATVIPPAGTDSATAEAYVKGWFRLGAGLKPVQTVHGGVTLQAQAEVVGIAIAGPSLFRVSLRFPDPTWRTTTTTTVTASPFTVGGNAPALPVVTLTPTGTAIKRRRVTITDPGTGGYASYPVAMAFDSTGVSATTSAKFRVLFQGRDVPFVVVSPNTVSTVVWAVVDIPAGGSAYLDVYYGAAVTNTLTADQLNDGGMNLATSTNVSWIWDSFEASTFPDRAGAWRPIRFGVLTGATYGLAEAAGSAVISVVPTATGGAGLFANDYNAIVLSLGGAKAGTTNALAGLSRVLNGLGTDTGVRARVYYRVAGSAVWTSAWSLTWTASTQTVTTAIDLDNAVEILIVVESVSTPAINSTYTLTLSASGTFSLALANTPTVSVAAAVDAHVIDGTLTIGGNAIILDDVLTDGAIKITCTDPRSIAHATDPSRPVYGSIRPAVAAGWLPLLPGSNSYTLPANTSPSIDYSPAYAL